MLSIKPKIHRRKYCYGGNGLKTKERFGGFILWKNLNHLGYYPDHYPYPGYIPLQNIEKKKRSGGWVRESYLPLPRQRNWLLSPNAK